MGSLAGSLITWVFQVLLCAMNAITLFINYFRYFVSEILLNLHHTLLRSSM